MKSGKLKKLQITHRIDDGLQHENPRESILTSIEFVQENSPDIQTLIKKLHDLIYERKVSLAEAYKTTIENSESKIKTKSLGGWIAHAEAYKETKSDRRESTLKDLNFRLELACNLLKAQPKPRNSKDFYLKLKKQYFDKAKMLNGEIKNPKGGNGRLRICNDIAAFLKYSVLEKGENTRWLAPDSTWRRENIIQTNDKENEPKVPLKSQELVTFMNILEKEGKHSFRLVVGLMGCFGLRPAEIGAMYPERGLLKIGTVKRNKQSMNKKKSPPKKVSAVDPEGLEGEGNKLVMRYEIGELQLPLAVKNAIATGNYKKVGNAIRQIWNRHWYIKQLNKNKKKGERYVPYSCRHGFSYRLHCEVENRFDVREIAKLMRHKPKTHMENYNEWVDEESLEILIKNIRYRSVLAS